MPFSSVGFGGVETLAFSGSEVNKYRAAHLFDLVPGSASWEEQKIRFITAWENRNSISADSRRKTLPPRPGNGFSNTPDTDWTQPAQRALLTAALADGPVFDPSPLES